MSLGYIILLVIASFVSYKIGKVAAIQQAGEELKEIIKKAEEADKKNPSC